MTEFDLMPFRELLAGPSREAYKKILDLLVQELGAERGCFYLDKENIFLYQGDEKLRETFPFSRQAVDAVLEAGSGFISLDPDNDSRLDPTGSIRTNFVRSCVCACGQDAQGEVLVLAYFDSSTSRGPFSEDCLDKLKTVLDLFPGAVASQ